MYWWLINLVRNIENYRIFFIPVYYLFTIYIKIVIPSNSIKIYLVKKLFIISNFRGIQFSQQVFIWTKLNVKIFKAFLYSFFTCNIYTSYCQSLLICKRANLKVINRSHKSVIYLFNKVKLKYFLGSHSILY
jgi:hypothetical protein